MIFPFLRRRHGGEHVHPDPPSRDDWPTGESTGSETLGTLRYFEKMHALDPNMPIDELNEVDAAIASGNAEKGVQIEQVLMEDNSPYPEVRASVRNYDVDMPANTVRAWVIGMLLCTIGSGVNMLFSLRAPSVQITTFVIQLVAYPIGRAWDLVFPDREWHLLGLRFNLRPGRFNFKEHVVIVVMSNAAYGGGALYATDVIISQKVWYGQDFGWAFEILLGITTLCTGYGIAGLARRFLVWPAAMIWPADLVNAQLFYTLHDHSPSDPARANGWRLGRYRWFLIIFFSAFAWYWFPGYLFAGLSYFSLLCWIWPGNITVNELFGPISGYGLLPITFDWTIVSGWLTSPLIPPFHAIANTMAGTIFFFVFVSMGLHYSNTWYSLYFPIQNPDAYDNMGMKYDMARILTKFQFDEAKYKAYSPLFLSIQFALAYGLAFASVSAVVVHVALYHGRTIWQQFKLARNQEDDVHMRLMKKYRDAEDWWYAVLFVIMLGLSFTVVCAWPTDFPWWAFAVCIVIPVVMLVPIGIIQAVTNIQIGLNVLTEYVVGYMLPGRPLAMMMFKNYGYLCMSQALYFAQDLKLGHYMKVPPRVLFSAQLVASIWSAIVQICVLNWGLATIPDVCSQTQEHNYSCPNARVFYTASIIWGAIGPARMFSGKALYAGLQWFWLVGAVVPIITYILARRWPKSIWRYVNMPLIFGGCGYIPPATVYNYLCWGTVGVVFNFFIKRRWTGWWLNYNYITSAALDCGLFLSTIVVFFALQLPGVSAPLWWGNSDAFATMDTQFAARQREVPWGEKVGPEVFP